MTTVSGTETDARGAAELLEQATSVTVVCHVNPDADALGSALALGTALRRRGTPVQVAFADPAETPESLRTLPGGDLLVAPGEVSHEVDVLVVVDCGSAGRMGALRDRMSGAREVLVVDHHVSNARFGSINLVDGAAESTTVLVCEVLDAWGVPLDRDLAHCLYAGLVTDTASFRWARPATHELAARLLATGIDPVDVSRPLMDTHPFGWLGMLASVLGSAGLHREAAGGLGLAHAVVRCSDREGMRAEETESVVDLVRTASEAEVAAVLKEGPPRQWSVSLRAKSVVDVSAVAALLGGGGHRRSAGYTAHGSSEDVLAALRTALG
jgi:phosphoesterase RecJ-like protein